jgi:hypothetical protein
VRATINVLKKYVGAFTLPYPYGAWQSPRTIFQPMKTVSAVLGLVVVLLLAAVYYQYHQTNVLQDSLAVLGKDRVAMNRQLERLNDRIADLQRRPAVATTVVAPSGNAAGAAVVPIAPPPAPVERPGVTVKAPSGWAKNGAKPEAYVVGVDSTQTWGGMPSAYVQSLTPEVDGGFGGMMQTTSAENYVGKRVRLSGWVKTEDANEGGGHLWLRIDGETRGQSLQFDNMDNRAVKGSSDWQEASVVLDVPAGATALAYGFFVAGGGKMWVNGQKIEEVGADVPSTNMLKKQILPAAPRNLGFSPGGSK